MGEIIKKKIYMLLFIKFILVFVVALGLNLMSIDSPHNIFVDMFESMGIAGIITFIAYLFLKKDIDYYNKFK